MKQFAVGKFNTDIQPFRKTKILLAGLLCFCVIFKAISQKQNSLTFVVRGKITEFGTGEPVIGANIYFLNLKRGTTTNSSGEYAIWLKEGKHLLHISSVGFQQLQLEFEIHSDTTFNQSLSQQASSLDEIIIYGQDDRVNSLRLGQNTLDLSTLKKIPPLLGEADIIRGLLLLPGVSTVGEGATGYNVRGGSVDQNLILLEDAPIFNTSHLFGFLTAFNSNAVQNAELYKGGIPATYGGRVASVLDVKLKQGNANRVAGQAGVGLMSTNLTLEGPIIKDRTTFLISGRGSYSDWLLKAVRNETLRGSDASFYDGIAKITHALNKNHRISFTSYTSHDSFKFPGDTTYGWNTQNFSLKLGSTLKPNLFLMSTLVSSDYNYKVNGREPTNEFNFKAGINFISAKADATLTFNEDNKAEFGIGVDKYGVNLGNREPVNNSNINFFSIDREKATIASIYYSHQLEINERISLRAGLRFSSYQLYGPGKINQYEEGVPRSEATFQATSQFNNGDPIQHYDGFEPRFSARFSMTKRSSIKFGADRTLQYVHLISNTSAVSPVDLWKLSDPYLKPQTGDQLSLGYFRTIGKKNFDLSTEVFYKRMNNVVDYKDGAELLLNDKLEASLLQGEGRSYGMEWMLEKNHGNFTGWFAYTLSRTERKISGAFPEETINKGKYYPANYDKLHNVSITGNYQFTKRASFGFNFVFSTGRPITYPTSSYGYGGIRIVNYEYRNNERSPDYHRMDLSLEIKSKFKPDRKWKSAWVVSVYNVYARKNPYSIFFRSEHYVTAQSFKLSVIGTIVPSLSYTINF